MEDRKTTRSEQHPDWMVGGLLRAAMAEEPQGPLYKTGVTFQELKTQIRGLLGRSGLDLTASETAMGTHWLAHRIANQIGEEDTRKELAGYVSLFVNQYVVDKMAQHGGGVADRSQIHSREWYERHFTPSPEQAKEKGDEPPMGRDASIRTADELGPDHPLPMAYVGLDGDDIGGLVEETLTSDDPEKAAAISESIHEAHRQIARLTKAEGGRVIFDGGDNMLLHIPYDPEMVETMRFIYKEETGHTATVGVGKRPVEAHYALVVGKNTGKNKTVVYDESVAEQHEAIRKEQERIAPLYEKMKYQAAVATDAAPRLQKAMAVMGMPIDDESVYEMFVRLVERFGLHDADSIDRFFADSVVLRDAIVKAHTACMTGIVTLGARKLTDFEVGDLLSNLMNFVDVVDKAQAKFTTVEEAIGDKEPTLKALSAELKAGEFRCAEAFLKLIAAVDQGRLRHSSYLETVAGILAETTSLCASIDNEAIRAVKARDNSDASHPEGGVEVPVDTRPLGERMTRLVDRVCTMAVTLEMMGVASDADPKMLTAAPPTSAPLNFPGQSNMPKPRTKQSPHRKDSLTTEQENDQKVDYRKTDWQYVSTNIPAESQMMVGGDAGNPIYVP